MVQEVQKTKIPKAPPIGLDGTMVLMACGGMYGKESVKDSLTVEDFLKAATTMLATLGFSKEKGASPYKNVSSLCTGTRTTDMREKQREGGREGAGAGRGEQKPFKHSEMLACTTPGPSGAPSASSAKEKGVLLGALD